MKKQTVSVFISLYEGSVDEVLVFRDHGKGENYYRKRVKADYGTMEEYEKALDYCFLKTEYRLHCAELK